MNTKAALISILAMVIAAPAMAGAGDDPAGHNVVISADAESADCDHDVLATYSDSASLEADWTANTITLHWYNDNTEIDTTGTNSATCTYDGTITLPSTNPTKQGYTFTGWQVRTITFDLSTLSDDICDVGTQVGYARRKMFHGNSGSNQDTYGLTPYSGEWAVTFDYGTVKGESICSTIGLGMSKGQTGNPTNDLNQEGSVYCWCKATLFSENSDNNYVPVSSSVWVYDFSEDTADYCASGCALSCSFKIRSDDVFRRAVYGVVNGPECEAPYVGGGGGSND